MAKRIMLVRPAYQGQAYVREPVGSPVKSPRIIAEPPPLPSPSKEGRREGVGSASASSLQTADAVLPMIAGLSPTERKRLLDQLALELQTTDPGNSRDKEMWATAIYDALQSALGASAGAMGGPMLIRRAVVAASAWRPVEEFMVASKLADLPVMQRQQAYRQLASLVVDYAKRVARQTRAPMGPKLLANCSTNLAGVFEDSFPGYLANGLAHMIARSEIHV